MGNKEEKEVKKRSLHYETLRNEEERRKLKWRIETM